MLVSFQPIHSGRLRWRWTSAVALAIVLLWGAASAQAHGVRRFDNARWFDGSAFVPGTWYSVEGTLQKQAPAGAEIDSVDLAGAYVVPAMGNAHRHGLTNDFAQENTRLLSMGVFSVANPNSILRFTRDARPLAEARETVDVRYSNGGLTSPGGHPAQIYDGLAQQLQGLSASGMDGEAYYAIADLSALEARWSEILAGKPDFLKLYLERSEHHAERRDDPAFYGKRGLDPQLIAPIVERAHRNHLRVAVHVTSSFDFHTAVAAGADEIAHLPLEPIDPADAALAARRGVTVVTTTLSHRPHDEVDDLDQLHRSNLQLLHKHGVAVVLGTDSSASVIDEALNIQRIGAMDTATLLRNLTQDTPRWIFPDRKIGAIQEGSEANFVCLQDNPLESLEALRTVQRVVKGGHVLQLQLAQEKPGVGQQLVHTLMSQGVDAAIAEYHRMRREETDQWDFSEGQLNALGYAMKQHGKLDVAIRIFELNTEMYPEGFNAWDSLAEAQLANGDTTAAITNYQRSLELNPNNEGARKQLAELQK